MTLQELSQLLYLKKEIETEKNRLERLEQASKTETFRLPDLPQCSMQSLSQETVRQIADCKKIIEKRVAQSMLEYKRLSDYVAKIEDVMLRRILTLRFIQGMSWVQVAFELGGGNSPDGVRMMVKRYLAKQD